MNTQQLAKNIRKPFFIDNIFINDNDLKTNISINPETLEYNFFYKILIKSNNLNLNDINIFELITWLNSFDFIKVVDWDDDKYYDFSKISLLSLIIDFNLISSIIKNDTHTSKFLIKSELNKLAKCNNKILEEIMKIEFIKYLKTEQIINLKHLHMK